MKFELIERDAVRNVLIHMVWSWDEWRMVLWRSHAIVPPTHTLCLSCVYKETGARTPGAIITPSGSSEVEPRVRMAVLTPLLMLSMWVIKEFEPLATGAINRHWAEIMLHLGWEPHDEYVYPTIDQIAELYKEGGPEWKHLL